MDIQRKEKAGKGSFFIEIDGKQLAEMTYSLPEHGIMTINHTEVDDSLRGQNAGNQLLNMAVEYARQNNLKIKPYCPFAKAVFEKKKEKFKDVLYVNE
jgi:predicted GNAT family acetyltransferase